MKHIFSILIFVLCSLSCSAQSRQYEKTVKALSSETNVHQMTFSKQAFELLTLFDISMKDELRNIIDDIDQMKLIVASGKSKNAFSSVAAKTFGNAGYKYYDLSKYDSHGKSKAYVKRRFFHISEAHIIVDYGKGAVVSFFGNFRIRDIRKLIKGADKVGTTSVGN